MRTSAVSSVLPGSAGAIARGRRHAAAFAGARPSIGHVRAFFRFLRDRDASFFGKLFVFTAIAYVIMPLDLIPDVAPVVGWLDDLGVVGLALAYLARVLARYRYEPLPAFVAR